MTLMFFRLFAYVVSAWAIIAVWSGDPLAQGANARNAPIYWTLIAILAVTILFFEIRDLVKSSAK